MEVFVEWSAALAILFFGMLHSQNVVRAVRVVPETKLQPLLLVAGTSLGSYLRFCVDLIHDRLGGFAPVANCPNHKAGTALNIATRVNAR
ncbi:hypothetical protein BCF46_3240 [Litoreibacter meonggei]|uniref:Uncharacterized protein n=1 Tax=Litoreibacter meonggei TaxID=1049199 RepID=A0A497VGT8_9RHOB|nr:hypothetical protein BCF46_3240 [Litoreibacter meonggei]